MSIDTLLYFVYGTQGSPALGPFVPPRYLRYVRHRTEQVAGKAYPVKVLHEFLTANRSELIERCRLKVAKRLAPKAAIAELAHGIPRFLDQLIKTLQVEQTSAPMREPKGFRTFGRRTSRVRDRHDCGVAWARVITAGIHG